ncbi:MAG: hypothetical protein HC821_05280 [Lewinella sp.]|nr:hypothetical protein [Lewinella sp.]
MERARYYQDLRSEGVSEKEIKAEANRSFEHFIFRHPGLRHGVYTYRGCLTNHYLGKRFEMKATDLDLLLTSSF